MKEKHLTIVGETISKLKFIVETERRTFRAVITDMIDKKYKELKDA